MLNDYDGIKSKYPSLVNKIVQEKYAGEQDRLAIMGRNLNTCGKREFVEYKEILNFVLEPSRPKTHFGANKSSESIGAKISDYLQKVIWGMLFVFPAPASFLPFDPAYDD